jgi:hypothetical protein
MGAGRRSSNSPRFKEPQSAPNMISFLSIKQFAIYMRGSGSLTLPSSVPISEEAGKNVSSFLTHSTPIMSRS